MGHEQESDSLPEIAELRKLVLDQSARIADLEARLEVPPVEERSTRRGMLRLAGAAVVGGAAASLIGTQPAAATIGNLQFGVGSATNNAGVVDTGLQSASAVTFTATNTVGTVALSGIASGDGTAVTGTVNSPSSVAWGVAGNASGSAGFGLVGQGGAAQLYLIPHSGTTAPSSGSHNAGEVVCNSGGFFTCVAAGSPGTWRKLSGTASAGTFHAITPTRVYDSRAAAPAPGLLATGANRTISVADGRDGNGAVTAANVVPAGATAVAANITVTGTTGGFGYLAINPGGNVVEGASTINWFGAGQTLANGVGLTLNATRQLTVICNGGGSTHFIVDISGYYL